MKTKNIKHSRSHIGCFRRNIGTMDLRVQNQLRRGKSNKTSVVPNRTTQLNFERFNSANRQYNNFSQLHYKPVKLPEPLVGFCQILKFKIPQTPRRIALNTIQLLEFIIIPDVTRVQACRSLVHGKSKRTSFESGSII